MYKIVSEKDNGNRICIGESSIGGDLRHSGHKRGWYKINTDKKGEFVKIKGKKYYLNEMEIGEIIWRNEV